MRPTARTPSKDFSFLGVIENIFSIWYNPQFSPHRHNAYVADTEQGTKDTMITGMVGDGTVLPPFIATTKKIPDTFDPPIEEEYKISYMPEDKAQSVDMMIKYLDWLRANKYLTKNEVVLLDRGPGAKKGESKSLSEDYHGWFEDHGIKYVLYPVGAGSIQSPNDVHFHSQLKLRMHKALEMKLSTVFPCCAPPRACHIPFAKISFM